MNRASAWTRIRIGVFLVIVLGLAALGTYRWAVTSREPLAWNSPRMVEIEREWNTLSKTFEPVTKETWDQRDMARRQLLRRNLSCADLRHLARTCDTLPQLRLEDLRSFTHYLLGFMEREFRESGDRDSLAELYSRRYPSHIGGGEGKEDHIPGDK
jgi:hypothetical protein